MILGASYTTPGRIDSDARQTTDAPHDSRDYLTNLPYEILCKIVAECDSLDIILNIRPCSVLLAKISIDREVWFNQVDRLCQDMRLPKWTLGYDGLSASDLERLAANHIYFFTSAGRHEEDKTFPRTSRWILPGEPSTTATADGTSISFAPISVRFISGGRYLLTLEKSILKLWDLGLFSSCTMPSSYLASTDVSKQLGWTDVTEVRVEIHCLRHLDDKLVFTIIAEELGTSSCLMFEVCPGSAAPEFVFVGSYVTQQFARFCMFWNHCIVFYVNDDFYGTVSIYDTKSRLTWCWSLSAFADDLDVLDGEDPSLISCAENGTVVVYPIPQCIQDVLSGRAPIPSSSSPIDLDVPPLFSERVTINPNEDPVYPLLTIDRGEDDVDPVVSMSVWMLSYDAAGSRLCFDFAFQLWHGLMVKHVRLVDPTMELSQGNWNLDSVHREGYVNLDLPPSPYSITFPNGLRAMWWHDPEERLHLHVSDFFRKGKDFFALLIDMSNAEADEAIYLDWTKYALGPWLGRLCWVSKDGICIDHYT